MNYLVWGVIALLFIGLVLFLIKKSIKLGICGILIILFVLWAMSQGYIYFR